jgi:hypothetical protein
MRGGGHGCTSWDQGDYGARALGSDDMAPLPRRSHAAGGDIRPADTPSPTGKRPTRTAEDAPDRCLIESQTLCPPRSVLRTSCNGAPPRRRHARCDAGPRQRRARRIKRTPSRTTDPALPPPRRPARSGIPVSRPPRSRTCQPAAPARRSTAPAHGGDGVSYRSGIRAAKVRMNPPSGNTTARS